MWSRSALFAQVSNVCTRMHVGKHVVLHCESGGLTFHVGIRVSTIGIHGSTSYHPIIHLYVILF